MAIIYEAIGIIHTPYKKVEGMPIQPASRNSAHGLVELYPAYVDGLADLDGFSHIFLLYHLHQAQFRGLTVVPFLDDASHGLFATRAPSRPNPIGLSLVPLLGIEGTMLHVGAIDILDGTPLLDIKPYVPAFDDALDVRTGWLETSGQDAKGRRADGRFRSEPE